MFILGLLALVQLTFLPGFLFLRGIKLYAGFIKTLILSFALSLVINYCLVVLMIAAHIYVSAAVLLVFAGECILFGWFYHSAASLSLGQVSARILAGFEGFLASFWVFRREFDPAQDDDPEFFRLLRLGFYTLAGILALSAILWLFQVFRANLGTVFNSWDAVLSWNRWAVILAGNHFPIDSGTYPQLLPANLSLTYIFSGSTQVQFFAKALMPLFSIYMLLLLADLGLQYKTAGFFLAAVVARYMLKKFLGDFIPEGYADIPAAFFCMAALFCIFQVRDTAQESMKKKYLWLGMLMAAGGAVTKQMAIYLLVLYPVLAWLALSASQGAMDRRQKLRTILIPFAVGVMVVFPWYLFKQIQIWTGLDQSNLNYLVSTVHHIADPLQRLLPAFQSFGKYAVLLVLMIPFAFLLNETLKGIIFLFALPLWFLWALYFSYDIRNAAILFPVIALVSGLGVDQIFQRMVVWLSRLRTARIRVVFVLPVLIVPIILAAFLLSPDPVLIDHQIAQQKQIFSPSINRRLYQLFPTPGPELKILTNYPVAYLPGFEKNEVAFFFNNYPDYELLRKDPKIQYILLPAYGSEDILNDILDRVERGEYRIVFEDSSFGHYYFVQIH
jgi:hypothetical protein